MQITLFKLLDPDTGKPVLIGITERSKAKTMQAIMRDGSITHKANQLIQSWIKQGKTPKIVLSQSNVGRHGTPLAIRDIAKLMDMIVLEETLDILGEIDEEQIEED